MSKLPETSLEPAPLSSEERFEKYFGELPLQAVLNSLYAYKPGRPPTERATMYANWRMVTDCMERVYSHLLESAQRDKAIDLTQVNDSQLQAVADYLWSLDEMKKFAELRQVGGKVIDITTRLPA